MVGTNCVCLRLRTFDIRNPVLTEKPKGSWARIKRLFSKERKPVVDTLDSISKSGGQALCSTVQCCRIGTSDTSLDIKMIDKLAKTLDVESQAEQHIGEVAESMDPENAHPMKLMVAISTEGTKTEYVVSITLDEALAGSDTLACAGGIVAHAGRFIQKQKN